MAKDKRGSRHPDPPEDEGVGPTADATARTEPPVTASEPTGGELADDQRELDQLRRSLEEERDRHVRLRADFENFRRRVARQNGAEHTKGRRESILPLLEVVDSFEHALEHGSSDEVFLAGIGAIHRKLMTALREAGAEPMETVGRPFDPKLHEVVATQPVEGAEPQTVVRDVRRGWRLGGDLLRPAQVIVAVPSGSGE